jgi:hypothetical protein
MNPQMKFIEISGVFLAYVATSCSVSRYFFGFRRPREVFIILPAAYEKNLKVLFIFLPAGAKCFVKKYTHLKNSCNIRLKLVELQCAISFPGAKRLQMFYIGPLPNLNPQILGSDRPYPLRFLLSYGINFFDQNPRFLKIVCSVC